MKTVIGIPARGNDFFRRKHLTEEIWTKLEAGSNLLLVAPRRVGKTSILLDLLDSPKPGFLIIYKDTESINNPNEFFKKLLNSVNEKFNPLKKYKNKIETFSKELASRIDSFSLKDVGFNLGESKFSYEAELENLFEKLEMDDDRIVILVDEFAQTVENIIEDVDVRTAINFLEVNRRIRLLPSLSKKVQFIYAGSIGLENIASSIDALKFINDLTPIAIPPLTKAEAKSFVKNILSGNDVELPEADFNFLLTKIEWLIPFYFQIILDECGKTAKESSLKIIDQSVIETAITSVLKHRAYFENWFIRLRTAYKGDEFSFVKEILNISSINSSIASTEIYDRAVKFKLENSFKNLINALMYDGYIHNSVNPKIYQFNSPLLKEWWYRNVAN